MMDRSSIINQLKKILHQVAPNATTILYGSEARGDANPDSDIDLLILIDKEKVTLKDRQEITFPLYDIEIDTGVIISPKVFSRKQWEEVLSITPFYHNVMNEGIIL